MQTQTVFWRDEQGRPIACAEKLKMLNGNLEELRQMCADALEDAVLIGCADADMRNALRQMIDQLPVPFRSA